MNANNDLIASIEQLRQSLPAPMERRKQLIAALGYQIEQDDVTCIEMLRTVAKQHEARCGEVRSELHRLAAQFNLVPANTQPPPIEQRYADHILPARAHEEPLPCY